MYDVAHESDIDQGEGDANPQGELQEFSIGFSHSCIYIFVINLLCKDKGKGGKEVSKKCDWCLKNNC